MNGIPNEIFASIINYIEDPVSFAQVNSRLLKLVELRTFWQIRSIKDISIVPTNLSLLIISTRDILDIDQIRKFSATKLVVCHDNIAYGCFIQHEILVLSGYFIFGQNARIALRSLKSKLLIKHSVRTDSSDLEWLLSRLIDTLCIHEYSNIVLINLNSKMPLTLTFPVKIYINSEDITETMMERWRKYQGSKNALKNQCIRVRFDTPICSIINPSRFAMRFARDVCLNTGHHKGTYPCLTIVRIKSYEDLNEIILPRVKVITINKYTTIDQIRSLATRYPTVRTINALK